MANFFRTNCSVGLGSWSPVGAGTLLACINDVDSSYAQSTSSGAPGQQLTLELNPLPGEPAAVVVSVHCKAGSGTLHRLLSITLKDAAGTPVAIAVPNEGISTLDYMTVTAHLTLQGITPEIDGPWSLDVKFDDEEFFVSQIVASYTPAWGDFTKVSVSETGFDRVGTDNLSALNDPEDAEYLFTDSGPGASLDKILVDVNPSGLTSPDDVQIFVGIRGTTGTPTLYFLGLFDGADNELFANYWNEGLDTVTKFRGRNLTKSYLGTPDNSVNWRLELWFLIDSGESVTVEWVAATYDAGGGSGGPGPGPGGQLGPNASILIPLMVQP